MMGSILNVISLIMLYFCGTVGGDYIWVGIGITWFYAFLAVVLLFLIRSNDVETISTFQFVFSVANIALTGFMMANLGTIWAAIPACIYLIVISWILHSRYTVE